MILPRLSVWHCGDWFSERGPRRREPSTRWQPNKRLAEALCPLTSSLKADCVAMQLYRADSQTAGLVIINPSAQRWSPAGQAHFCQPECGELTFFWLHRLLFMCIFHLFVQNLHCCTHMLFSLFIVWGEEDAWDTICTEYQIMLKRKLQRAKMFLHIGDQGKLSRGLWAKLHKCHVV